MKISVNRNSKLLYLREQRQVSGQTDKMFVRLLLVQWLACICIAIWITPRAWAGVHSSIHFHVLISIFLGGALCTLPAYLAWRRPGKVLTRLSIALCQALFSCLIILLTGGRIESHFHIFLSLALLSFYWDRRVVLTYASVIILDHLLRGLFWPFSMYGVLVVQPLRTFEHAFWVVLTVVCIFQLFQDRMATTRKNARTQAELIETKSSIEQQVCDRTKELVISRNRMATQHAITFALSEGPTLKQAAPEVIEALCSHSGWQCGAMWTINPENKSLKLQGFWQSEANEKSLKAILDQITLEKSEILSGVIASKQPKLAKITDLEHDGALSFIAESKESRSALAFPLKFKDRILGVVLLCDDGVMSDSTNDLITQVEAIGEQLGGFIVRKEKDAEASMLASLVHHASDAIVTCDTRRNIIGWNLAAEKQYGYSLNEVRGKNIRILLRPEDKASLRDFREILTGKQKIREDVHVRKDGSLVDVQVTFALVPDASGSIVGIGGIIRDISARRESEQRVNEFYSTVSHELRTPLTSICGALGLIEGGFLDKDEEADLIQIARQSADRLVRLINDMLDLKKLENGKVVLDMQAVEPQNIVGQALDSVSGLAAESGVELHSELKTNTTFTADPDRVVQMLINLLGNAIKFSPVKSAVEVIVESASPSAVRFSVIDHGEGIPAHQLHKLFARFQQLDSSDTRQKGGTGLGLAITKALAEQHGGQIGVDSELGKGSTFWFELPTEHQLCAREFAI